MSVCAVVGGQFGSEGKGLVVGHIAEQYDHHVRVGAANAGHTVYTKTGPVGPGAQDVNRTSDLKWEKHVMQQIPCAAYANPLARLYIGPGAQISMEIFRYELDELQSWRQSRGLPEATIYVDARAHVIRQAHIDREQESGLAERIGSTSTIAKEGIGAAQAARVMREESCMTAEWYFTQFAAEWLDVVLCDVPARLAEEEDILLEGTQGTSLSLTTGAFPYVTSRNTTAAGLAADCGVAPTRLSRVILVCRTFPIRVAGPSGPFWHDSEEIEWKDIGIDSENERTTVTKKVRRVATFSHDQVREACILNGPTEIALTFADYLDPDLAGRTNLNGLDTRQIGTIELVEGIIERTGVEVSMLGTGPHSIIKI